RVAHLGDLGHLPGEEIVKALDGVDILLLPVGGFYTIDAATAKQVVGLVNPKTVVPMHYREGEFGHEPIGTLEDFLELMEGVPVTKLEGNFFDTPIPAGVVVPKFGK
ncbi:MAG: MBL fold metallo-hydrolase, partial [Clostridia bacterium]|nr:MBL fold metallo-hydrolase [Clostridia bacterium]